MCTDKVHCCDLASHSQSSRQSGRVGQSSKNTSAVSHGDFEDPIESTLC
jgi:hypothetical protein